MAISEGPGDETWLILDSLHSWTQWGLHRRVRVNIKQKWPSALEGLTPTTSRSPLVLKKHELSDSESPVTVHITSATSYPKHFLGVVLNAELVSVDTVGFVSFTTPPSSLSPRPKLGTLGEFIVLAQLEPSSILRMARKSSSLEQVNVFNVIKINDFLYHSDQWGTLRCFSNTFCDVQFYWVWHCCNNKIITLKFNSSTGPEEHF